VKKVGGVFCALILPSISVYMMLSTRAFVKLDTGF